MSKFIKDCIYGHITIPPLCISFMDTPEFQRLRRIRQLGVAYYAYPSATHTRFEHSIGVMHLAGKMVQQLRNYIFISDRQKELIELAGMYHDIGHFSFSHLFDGFLVHQVHDDTLPKIFLHHHHEDRSVYFLRKVNTRLQLLSSADEQFVCDCITGYIPPGHLSFLYQIVCNKECGIDVDKMDYIKRDSYHTGFPDFQSDFIIHHAIIDPHNHLSFRTKVKADISDLFLLRKTMHDRIYQHHTVLLLDKLFFCLMRRLSIKLYQYGELTDDFNIETLFRNSPETIELMHKIDNRQLHHECDLCSDYKPIKNIVASGTTETVRFYDKIIK